MTEQRSVQIRTITGWTNDSGTWDDSMPGRDTTYTVEIGPDVDPIEAAVTALYRHGCTEWIDGPWPYRAEPSSSESSSHRAETHARLVGFTKAEESRLREALREAQR